MKKRIGISFTKTNFQNYLNWFTSEDLQNDIELVELSFKKNNLQDIEICNAFILSGGIDIDPLFYNEISVGTKKTDIVRDQFEKKIFEYSQNNHLPLLGICRGMQLVNVLQGGKLIQDLGDLNKTHNKNDYDKEHQVKIEKDSLLGKIIPANPGKVNSAHHQAVDKNALGKNLMINAYSEDGTVEGIEFKDKTGKAFMICVQWHPERMNDKEVSLFSKNIKVKFLEQVRK